MTKKDPVYIPELSCKGLVPVHSVTAFDSHGVSRTVDIAGEQPLTIFMDDREIVTLMTLGTHPEELALGYLRNQRLITDIENIESVCVDWNTESARIKTRDPGHSQDIEGRLTRRTITSGCGQGTLLGCTMEELYEARPEPITVYQSTLARLSRELPKHNAVYKAAGSVHGCALCQEDKVEVFIEDVGRHNALDTIAGQMWLKRIQGKGKMLYSTGRLTSEIVIKAALMDIPVVISRSGITHMGLELARDLGITMIARIKRRNFLVFNGHDRFIHDMEQEE
ncbi:MAG: formate dehydrogenase accessory sulfurtransferase FdhD [Desulfobacterales bacterium]|nr:formate dehydrogenase accessory sulfurtransferase FdhD [Desulfobacterales bacterium]